MLRDTPPPRLDDEPFAEDESGSLVTRIGTVAGGGVVAAVVASLPAVLRMGDGGSASRALDQWLALSAVLAPVSVLAVLVLRRARVGIRILVGERADVLAAAVLWWSALEVGLLSMFGAALRAKTHHQGLAGVTFAIFALVSGLMAALVAARGARMLARLPESSQRAALVATAGAAFVVLLLVGVRTGRAEGMHTAAALVDAFGLVVAAAIGSVRSLSRMRPFAIAGVPACAFILLVGLATLHAHPELRDAMQGAAPLHAWIDGLWTP